MGTQRTSNNTDIRQKRYIFNVKIKYENSKVNTAFTENEKLTNNKQSSQYQLAGGMYWKERQKETTKEGRS
jgi:hypothetical protein